MKRLGRPITWLCLAASLSGAAAMAESTRTQRYVVHVPPRVAVQSPTAAAPLRDAEVDRGAPTRRTWSVAATAPGGVTVSFHADDTAEYRAHPETARLVVSVGASLGAAAWTISVPDRAAAGFRNADRTDVQVSSNTAGSAELVLDMTVPDEQQAWMLERHATMTVTATVTSHD